MSDLINGKIIYAATPFRFSEGKIEEICDYIESCGNLPIHPFRVMPLEIVNYERYTRKLIMRACYGLIGASDEVWIFGIGSGSLEEYAYGKKIGKPVRSLVKAFDDEWEEFSSRRKYRDVFGEIFREVLNSSETSIEI